jgi:hypothetical protein
VAAFYQKFKFADENCGFPDTTLEVFSTSMAVNTYGINLAKKSETKKEI